MDNLVRQLTLQEREIVERLQRLLKAKSKLELADRPALLHAVMHLIKLDTGALASRGLRVDLATPDSSAALDDVGL
jgi:hypothetical protein